MPDQIVTALAWPSADEPPRTVPVDEALERDTRPHLVWIDVCGPTAETMEAIGARFGLHPLAIEDAVHGFQNPKIVDYESHLFVVWHVLPKTWGKNHRGARTEIHLFVGNDFLVSVTNKTQPVMADVRGVIEQTHGEKAGRPDWLLHAILDAVVDGYFPSVEALTNDADKLEETMLVRPDRNDLAELLDVKHRLLSVRRSVAPERDAMAYLARRESLFIGADAFPYFQDVYDHLNRIMDSVDVSRDIVQGAMDIYLSSVNNRLNEVMKQLTVVATIALPVTVVSSFFGMNFLWMVDAVKGPWAFLAAVVVMACIASGLYMFIRGKGW